MRSEEAMIKKRQRRLTSTILSSANAGAGRQRAATNTFLNSKAIHLIPAGKAIREGLRATHLTAEQIAQRTNLWQRCEEKVYVSAIAREQSYDYRFRLSFGPVNQTRQIVVSDLLRARAEFDEAQMLFRGGTKAAVQRAQNYYEQGFKYIKHVDVSRCFASFDSERMGSALRLPERVVEHTITSHTLNIVPSKDATRNVLYHDPSFSVTPLQQFEATFGDDWVNARQGLCEGSKASPVVAESLLAPVCQALSTSRSARVINYADNFLLMAKSSSDLSTTYSMLREALDRHPAGPLVDHEICSTKCNGAFGLDFLGYRLIPESGHLRLWISKKNERKLSQLRKEMHKLKNAKMPDDKKRGRLSWYLAKHKRVVEQFDLADGISDWQKAKLFSLFLEM